MNWLTPATGALLAAILVPIVILLYFLKLRRRSLPISSTLLWERSVEDLRANAPFQRLRPSLLLFLQLLALLLLLLAIMQPQIESERSAGGRSVFMIDTSASMNAPAADGDRTRLEAAIERAEKRINTMYGGGMFEEAAGETMIITFSDHAEVVTPFSQSRNELRAALQRIRPTHGTTDIRSALELARARMINVDPESPLPVGEPARLEIFSDGRIQHLEDEVIRGESITYHQFGSVDTDNVGIASLTVDRPWDRPHAIEVYAGLVNYQRQGRTCEVQLSVDGIPRAIRDIELPPAREKAGDIGWVPGRSSLTFTPFELGGSAVISLLVLVQDDLASDNQAWVVVPPARSLHVAVVDAGSRYVAMALEGMGLARVSGMTAVEYAERAGSTALEDVDLFLFDDCTVAPEDMPLVPSIFFGRPPPVDALHSYGQSEATMVLHAGDHPAVRGVDFGSLIIAKSFLIEPIGEVARLVVGTEGPLVVESRRAGSHVLYVAFDLLDSNWVFLPSFVAFLVDSVAYLGHFGDGLTSTSLAPGDAISLLEPPGGSGLQIELPGGAVVDLAFNPHGEAGWGPARVTGIHRLAWETASGSGRTQSVAVNQFDLQEGDIDALEELQIGQDVIVSRGEAASSFLPLWPLAMLLCLLVLTMEWWVYQRRLG